MNFLIKMQPNDAVDDALVTVCDELGYKLDINYLRGTVQIDTGRQKKSWSSTVEALAWARDIQNKIRWM